MQAREKDGRPSVSNMPSQHIWNRLLVAYMAYIDVCQHNAVIFQPKAARLLPCSMLHIGYMPSLLVATTATEAASV